MSEPLLTHRPLGRSGLMVAPLGLSGSFGIGAEATVRAFHELGVNLFFVSPRTPGVNEGVRNLIADGYRDQIVLQSGPYLPTAGSVRRSWEKMARTLGTERIDIFQLFWVRSRWYTGGKTWPAMQQLKEQGRVRALALSTHDRKLGRALSDELELDALMIRYNAAHRGAESEIFDSFEEPRPGVIGYTATRWRKLLEPAGELGPMSAPECYRFQLSHAAVDTTLCGARTWEELHADAEAVAQGPLSDERMAEVRAFGDAVRSTARGALGFGRSG